jgi:hypothetical protein
MRQRADYFAVRWVLLWLVCAGLCGGLCGDMCAQTRHAATEPEHAAYPQLVDITAQTGIHFEHLATPEQRYIVESMSGGVALIDYDRDGYPDIYFTNAASVPMGMKGEAAPGALYHNNHDGTFTDVTAKAGVAKPCWAMGAVVGDYNNDGWPDLLVTCFGGVVLYRNNHDGTFTDVTQAAGLKAAQGWATGASFGDYDGDGFADLFVADYVNFDLSDLPKFGSTVTCQYHGVAVQCGPRGLKGHRDYLFHNNGDGTFSEVATQAGVEDAQGYFGLTSVWTDLDGRGAPDLLVTNDGESNFLYRNDGHGHFTDQAQMAGIAVNQDGVEQANMGIAIGDYLHTGRLSVAISHFSDEYMALYRNDGDLNFTDVSTAAGIAAPTRPYVGWGDAFVDLDNDGWQDLFLVNGHVYPQVDSANTGTRYREPALLFENRHDGTFRNRSKEVGPSIQVPRVSRGLAVGDLFDDGRQELVIEDLEGSPTILRPEGGAQHHWIELSLVGTRSNRLALNARAKVTTGDLVQTDEVRSGGSYLSQNDLRLHFGLGEHARVDTVEVAWPSGAKQSFTGLEADHIYTITEGQAAAVPFASATQTHFHDQAGSSTTHDAASQHGAHP